MNDKVLLHDYSVTETESSLNLIKESIEKLPFTLSSPINDFVGSMTSGNYSKAMNHELDFFEMSSQYLSILLISLLKTKMEPEISKVLTAVVMKIDSKRPLSFGDWVNDILTPLCVAAAKEYRENEITLSLEKIIGRKKNIYLGNQKIPSIVHIRNEYKGHSTTLSDEIYKGVVYTLEDRLLDMLQALVPLHSWLFFSCKDSVGRISISHKGIEQKTYESTFEDLKNNHYYFIQNANEAIEKDMIDIYPLVNCDDAGFVYVFQTLRDDSVSFISSDKNAITYTTDYLNDSFDGYLQTIDPKFDIAKELNWSEWIEIITQESSNFLRQIYKEKKYNQELFVDRQRISEYFSNYRASSSNMLVLLGEAGQGKTNQLCYWTENMIEQNECILILSGAAFCNISLEDYLRKVLNVNKRKAIAKPLKKLHEQARLNKQTVYIFFDAINECVNYAGSESSNDGPLKLYSDICSIFLSEDYPCFKVVLTCRSFTWKQQIQQFNHKYESFCYKEEENQAVTGFTDSELVKAYHIYQNLYQIRNVIDEIPRSVKIRLKDPLVLKFACTGYLGHAFPESLIAFTSMSLFDKMLDDISHSYAGNKQLEIVMEFARIIFMSYENGKACDRVGEGELRVAYNDESSTMHHLSRLIYKKDGETVAYGELLNRPERPILRYVKNDNDNYAGEIQFIYERFLEFVMARVFLLNQFDFTDEVNMPVKAQTYIDELDKAAVNVVFMGAMRNALIIDVMRTGNLSTIIELVREYGDRFEIMQLVNDAMNVLITENYENELFLFINKLLSQQTETEDKSIVKLNAITKKIETNKATETDIEDYKKLSSDLAPLIRVRKLASVGVVNGIFRTDYFNENLYTHQPYDLLWKLLLEDITEVRNDTLLYIYYLSNKQYTFNNTKLDVNITENIIKKMYDMIKGHSLIINALSSSRRKMAISFLESATRLCTLLIIDAVMSQKETERSKVPLLLDEIRAIFRYFTAGFSLVHIAMPFFQIILRKQITFQSIYVNNAIEYQTFWEDDIVPQHSEDTWCRDDMKKILKFLSVEKDCTDTSLDTEFRNYHQLLQKAYIKGDSMSYFVIERILVIMGVRSWNNISPLMEELFSDRMKSTEWHDYIQMSALYVLFQVAVNSSDPDKRILEIYRKESVDWTKRCRGLFKAHNSYKANPTKLYKRNLMNWYCVVYCHFSGDGETVEGDSIPVPEFYNLIDDAIDKRDKELLFHCIENISELVSDFGYICTALGLIKHILTKINSREILDELNKEELTRDGIYKENLVNIIGRTLSTAKNYFPGQIDSFIKNDITGLKFPEISKYREEILDYNPNGETLSDLLTHRFGNFLMWSLIHEKAVKDFAFDAMAASVTSRSCVDWFDNVVRLLFKYLFKVKL